MNFAQSLRSALTRYRYPLTVALIAAPLFVLYTVPYANQGTLDLAMRRYLAGYARMMGAVLSVFEKGVMVTDNQIIGHAFSMRIVKTCDAMEVKILLVAALAGFPMSWARRFITVLTAIVAMVGLNSFRLCVLYWVGARSPSWFERGHQTLAPLLLVGCAVWVFFLLLPKRRQRDETIKADASA